MGYRLFRAGPAIRAALLLRPVCSLKAGDHSPPWMADIYPGFAAETRPIAMILGDDDPYCHASDAYALAASNPGEVRVAVVGGDHDFADRAGADVTERNLDLAVANAAGAAEHWLTTASAAAPEP